MTGARREPKLGWLAEGWAKLEWPTSRPKPKKWILARLWNIFAMVFEPPPRIRKTAFRLASWLGSLVWRAAWAALAGWLSWLAALGWLR